MAYISVPTKSERLINFGDGTRAIYKKGPMESVTKEGIETYRFRFRPLETMRYKYQIQESELDPYDGCVEREYPRFLCIQEEKDPLMTKWKIICNYNYRIPTSGNLLGFGDPMICEGCSQPIIDKIKSSCIKCLQPTDDLHEVKEYLIDGKVYKRRINRNRISGQFLINKEIFMKYENVVKENGILRRTLATRNRFLKLMAGQEASVHDMEMEKLAKDLDKVYPKGANANQQQEALNTDGGN